MVAIEVLRSREIEIALARLMAEYRTQRAEIEAATERASTSR